MAGCKKMYYLPDGETSERGEFWEGFHAHGLGRDQLDDSGITRLDGFGVGFSSLECKRIIF